MASAMNSYDALLGSSEVVATKDGNRKKKTKVKPSLIAQQLVKSQVLSI